MTGVNTVSPAAFIADPQDQWSELGDRRPPRRPSALARHLGLLVGAGAVVALLALGRTMGAIALVVLLAVVTVARLAVPSFDQAFLRLLARVGHGVGRLLALLLLGLVSLFIVAPVWAIARVARWDPLRIGATGPGRWSNTRVRSWKRLPDRPFTREGRPAGRRRLHGALIVVLPVALLVTAAFPLRHWVMRERAPGGIFGPDQPSAPEAEGPVVVDDGSEWEVTGQAPQRDGDPLITDASPTAAATLTDRVQIAEYDPTNTLRIRDSHTESFNYENRVRASWVPPTDGPMLDVWFFGSSMLFGPSIIRDDHTIASEMVRQAWEQDRIAVRASNFAIGGYETWQQMVLMAQMLSERPPPDLVVFYGGYNDLHNYLFPGAPTEVSNTWADDFARALEESGANVLPPAEDSVPVTASFDPANAAAIYDRGIDMTERILEASDIPFLNFLQPSLWTRESPENEATLESIGADQEYFDTFGAVYDAARAEIESEVVDLSDALDDLPGVLYWDEVHHNEAAAAAVAEAAYPHLRVPLAELWAQRAEP